MKTITLTKGEAISLFTTLKDAKVLKVTDEKQQFAIVRLIRNLRKIVNDFNSSIEGLDSMFNSDDHEDMLEIYNTWKEKGDDAIKEADRIKVVTYFAERKNKAEKFLAEERAKDVELSVPEIKEAAFNQLRSSNPFTLGQIAEMMDLLDFNFD